MNNSDVLTGPCPICGGTDYAWGDVRAQGLRFKAESDGFLSGFKWLTLIRSRRCETCRNIQMFDLE